MRDSSSPHQPDVPARRRRARRKRIEGEAIILIRVDSTGQITSVAVGKSSGHAVLDSAAFDVVRNRWRFSPGPSRYYKWECKFES